MSNKVKKYDRLLEQLKPLIEKSPSQIAKMSTINAVLYHKMKDFFWVGFYLLQDGQLVVGPYQGPLACQVLAYPKGVCWAAIKNKETIVVSNVEEFPDHIACDSRSKSEIVIPLTNSEGEVYGVLDVDSDKLAQFDMEDAQGLKNILDLL